MANKGRRRVLTNRIGSQEHSCMYAYVQCTYRECMNVHVHFPNLTCLFHGRYGYLSVHKASFLCPLMEICKLKLKKKMMKNCENLILTTFPLSDLVSFFEDPHILIIVIGICEDEFQIVCILPWKCGFSECMGAFHLRQSIFLKCR